MTERKERAPLLMVRVGFDLKPLDGLAAAHMERLPAGKPLRVEAKQPRSVPQNRLYWSLLEKVVENLPLEAAAITAEDLHRWIKRRLGYGGEVRVGRAMIETEGSTAFDNMTQPEFRRYFDAAKNLLCNEVIPGLNAPTLEREAALMLADREAA